MREDKEEGTDEREKGALWYTSNDITWRRRRKRGNLIKENMNYKAKLTDSLSQLGGIRLIEYLLVHTLVMHTILCFQSMVSCLLT